MVLTIHRVIFLPVAGRIDAFVIGLLIDMDILIFLFAYVKKSCTNNSFTCLKKSRWDSSNSRPFLGKGNNRPSENLLAGSPERGFPRNTRYHA
jgi:hypothetical protein